MAKTSSISETKARRKETRGVLGDPALMRQIRRSNKFYADGGKGLTFEEVFHEPLRPRKKRKRK